MINEELTFQKFGYYAKDLLSHSNKRIIVNCDGCGKERETDKNSYCSNCHSCSMKGKLKGIKRSEETKQRMSKAKIGRKFTEEHKRKISEAKKGWVPSKERNLKISLAKTGKKRIFSEQHIKNILKSICASPNKFEATCFTYLNTLNLGDFKFVGDGSVMINGRSPDFVNEVDKLVVLANGVYWHLGVYNLEVNIENKLAREKIEAKPFLEAGYNVMFIWEDEITNKKEIRIYFHKVWGNNGFKYNVQSNLEKYQVI